MKKLSTLLALASGVLAAPALASAPHPAALAQLQSGPSAGTYRLALVAGHLRPQSSYVVAAAVAGARPAGCAASVRMAVRSDARGDLRAFTPFRRGWCPGARYVGAIARRGAAPEARFSLSVPAGAAAQRVLVTGSVLGATRPFPRVTVTIETARRATVARVTTRPSGTFSVTLPGGVYRAVFPHVRGYAHTPAPRRFAATPGFVVTLRPSVYLR
jgi:hypothetical protein